MNIKVRDIVYVIDEDLSGEVLQIEGDKVVIQCSDGFEYTYLKDQLLKINEEDQSVEFVRKKVPFSSSNTEEKKQLYSFHRQWNLKTKIPLVDLHIEVLAPDKNFKSDHEVLLFQLECVREVMDIAMRKRIRKIVFVHGVGKGRLREEMRRFVATTYSDIEYYDGDYRKYGYGATEILIHNFHITE